MRWSSSSNWANEGVRIIIDFALFKDRVWTTNIRCRRGKKVYERIMDFYSPGTEVVIFPEDDSRLNYYGLLYLDERLVRGLKKDAIIVTSNSGVEKAAGLFTKKIRSIILVSKEEVEDLLSLYGVIDTPAPFIVVSLDSPEGRHADRMLGVKGLTVEQLVAIGVYFIIPFRPILRRFAYDGDDPEVLDILKEA